MERKENVWMEDIVGYRDVEDESLECQTPHDSLCHIFTTDAFSWTLENSLRCHEILFDP